MFSSCRAGVVWKTKLVDSNSPSACAFKAIEETRHSTQQILLAPVYGTPAVVIVVVVLMQSVQSGRCVRSSSSSKCWPATFSVTKLSELVKLATACRHCNHVDNNISQTKTEASLYLLVTFFAASRRLSGTAGSRSAWQNNDNNHRRRKSRRASFRNGCCQPVCIYNRRSESLFAREWSFGVEFYGFVFQWPIRSRCSVPAVPEQDLVYRRTSRHERNLCNQRRPFIGSEQAL